LHRVTARAQARQIVTVAEQQRHRQQGDAAAIALERCARGVDPHLPHARFDVANLEDAYLALVGRNELSRSKIEDLAL
jgi:hypothetical protein